MNEKLVPSSVIRERFRQNLKSGTLQRLPGVFSPVTARLAETFGFEGLYLSGATLSAEMGLPDIGLATVTEFCSKARILCDSTTMPLIADMDTGFGEPVQVARTVRLAEQAGLTGIHIEDQLTIKRCGHLDHKKLVTPEQMAQKIKTAVQARSDPKFLIIARTDARGPEGLNQATDRARQYIDAGADAIFPEALESVKEFETFRESVPLPLLANMTEFGKSPILDTQTLQNLGFNMVIWPVTLLRLALNAMEAGLKTLKNQGHQQTLLPAMMTRKELYKLLSYDDYERYDQDITNFKL